MWNSMNLTIPYPGNDISIAHTGPSCIFFDSWRPRWSNGCPPSTVTEAQLFPSPQFTLFWGFRALVESYNPGSEESEKQNYEWFLRDGCNTLELPGACQACVSNCLLFKGNWILTFSVICSNQNLSSIHNEQTHHCNGVLPFIIILHKSKKVKVKGNHNKL